MPFPELVFIAYDPAGHAMARVNRPRDAALLMQEWGPGSKVCFVSPVHCPDGVEVLAPIKGHEGVDHMAQAIVDEMYRQVEAVRQQKGPG